MPNNKHIAGVVVLYNPDKTVSENICTYVHQLNCLYVIDNSAESCEDIVEEFGKITEIKYFHFNENVGIAKALNIAAGKAINDGYAFLLTMDQDSSLSQNVMDEYRKYLSESNGKNIGILTLQHRIKNYKVRRPSAPYEELHTAFTSGSLLNLDAFVEAGPFNEMLIIDYVDHEYCLRLKEHHYQIIRINSTYCYHQLGELVTRRVLGFNIPVTNHSPLRLYYRTRNRLYVASKYYNTFTLWVFTDFARFLFETLTVLLFESQKMEKIKMTLRGFRDFSRGKYGKFIPI